MPKFDTFVNNWLPAKWLIHSTFLYNYLLNRTFDLTMMIIIRLHNHIKSFVWLLVIWFDDISTLEVYLKPVYTDDLDDYFKINPLKVTSFFNE